MLEQGLLQILEKVKIQIKQMKKDLRTASQTNDFRLLKLVLVMIVLLLVAAFVYGRIQL